MIGDGDRLVAPAGGLQDDIARLGNAVHIAHLRMKMQLHALLYGIIHPLFFFAAGFPDADNIADRQFLVEIIERRQPLQDDPLAFSREAEEIISSSGSANI